MAVAVRAVSTQGGFTNATSVTGNKPTGTASGDLLVAVVWSGATGNAAAQTVSMTGWTAKGSSASFGSGDNYTTGVYVFMKDAGGSEPSTYTATTTGSGGASADHEIMIYAITGAAVTASQPDVAVATTDHVAQGGTSGAAQITNWASVTTVTPSLILAIAGLWDGVGTVTSVTGTPTLTRRTTYNNASGYLFVADGIQSSAGATGARTVTPNGNNASSTSRWASILVPVAAAAGGTGTSRPGDTVTSTASVISGAPTTGVARAGTTLTATASVIPGTPTTGVSRAGQTLTATASVISGTPTTGVSISAQTLTVTASVIPGAASAGGGVSRPGDLVTCTASVISGAPTTGVARPGQTLTATASVISGAASAGGAAAPGALLTSTVAIIAGAASAGVSRAGVLVAVAVTLIPGAASTVAPGANISGFLFEIPVFILAGAAKGDSFWLPMPDEDNPWSDNIDPVSPWALSPIPDTPWSSLDG